MNSLDLTSRMFSGERPRKELRAMHTHENNAGLYTVLLDLSVASLSLGHAGYYSLEMEIGSNNMLTSYHGVFATL